MCVPSYIKLNESAVILIVKLIILIEMSKSMLWIIPRDIYCTQNGFSYAMTHIYLPLNLNYYLTYPP